MKVIVVKKHVFEVILLMIFIILIIIFCRFSEPSFAIKLESSDFLSEEIKEKFENLEKQEEKNVYLTFDDGPTLKSTPYILDILKEENVKASFFVIGSHVKEHPEITKRAYEEGHFIANHGYSHVYSSIYSSVRMKPIKNRNEVKNMVAQSTKSIMLDKLAPSNLKFNDIGLNTGGIVEINGSKVGIFKDSRGKIFAVKPVCTHLGCLLSWNDVDKTWDCPCHGSRFDFKGKNLYDPAIKNLETYHFE